MPTHTAGEHAWLHKLMPRCLWFYVIKTKFLKLGSEGLQRARRLPATNGLSVTTASEQSAARHRLLYAGQGRGLDFLSPQPSFAFCFSVFSSQWWAFWRVTPVILQKLLPSSAGGKLSTESWTFTPHHVKLTFHACCIDLCLFAYSCLCWYNWFESPALQ